MSMFSRQKLGKAAEELADHLKIIENVKALQTAQKEIADAMRSVRESISDLRADMKALRAELKLESYRETQDIVNSVQGAFYSKLQDVSNKVAFIEASMQNNSVEKFNKILMSDNRLTDKRGEDLS